MVKMSRILRDYREAGSVNGLLALWGFVDDTTFLTKAGHVGCVYQVRGIDCEGLTHAQRQALVHRFEAGLRLLDEHVRVYQYLLKRPVSEFTAPPCANDVAREAIHQRVAYLNSRRDDLYEFTVYLVVVNEASTRPQTSTRLRQLWRSPRRAVREWLTSRQTFTLLEHDLDRAIAALHQKAMALEIQLSDFGARRLTKAEAFRFFRMLVNYDAATIDAARLTYDTHLDYFVADSAIECHRDHLLVGQERVQVLSMKTAPSQTFAHVLGTLSEVPGEFIACLEWQRISSDRMRHDIQMRRRHFFNSRISMVNYLAQESRPEEMLVDHPSSMIVHQLGDAQAEQEVHGHFFGTASLTLVLHGRDARVLRQQAGEAMKLMAAYDGSLFEETYNLLNAWLSIVPGNSAHNLRRLALLETNVADLSFLFTPDCGEPISPHLRRPALLVFETRHQTPYAFNLHVQDVGHTVAAGATGVGKTVLMQAAVTHAQQYDPFTVILDLGHGYRKLATLLRGRYLELGVRRPQVTMNPFAFEPTAEHLHFLHTFTRVLLEGDDGYRVSDGEDRELYEAIESVYVLDRHQRRLFTLANILPRALAGRLHKWVEGGRYAAFFDNVEDTLTVEQLQVFDFEAMRAYPALLEPLLFYVLHRVTARIHDPADAGRLKLCVIDEAWRFIQHPALRAYVQEGLKTWRKHNAAMLLATQSIDDFASGDLLRTVIENCPTKLLLANPSFDRRQYAELFQLNEMELELVAGLVPRQQFLLKRPDVTKVLTLTVDPKSYWIYTDTPIDNARVAAMCQEFGFEDGMNRLAASA